MSFIELQSEMLTAQAEWENLVVLLHRGKLDFARPRPVLSDQSVTILSRKIRLVFEILIGLLSDKESDEVAPLVMGANHHTINNCIVEFSEQIKSLIDQLQPHWRDNTEIADTGDSFAFYLVEDNIQYVHIDTTPSFKRINELINGLLAIASSMLPLLKAVGVNDLSKRAEAVGLLILEVETFKTQAQSSATAAQDSSQRAAASEKQVRNIETETETIIATLRTLLTQANADVGAVTSLVEQIKTTGASASTLETLISDYQSKFEAFQQQLDDRNSEFRKFQQDKVEAEKVLKIRDLEITRLTDLADFMISGATTAGLAKSMEDARARYETRMNTARRGFYASVALLVLSSLPLAAQLLPGLFGSWIQGIDATSTNSPYVILGKFLLLIPATWCTAFFTKSYADLFHLEREYAHKAALAMSVDGFKRQAPGYEEEITAEVFMEIRTNPAKGQPVEAASHPLYDVLSKAVTSVLEKKQEDKDKK
jgi:uncharacterized protein YoxC